MNICYIVYHESISPSFSTTSLNFLWGTILPHTQSWKMSLIPPYFREGRGRWVKSNRITVDLHCAKCNGQFSCSLFLTDEQQHFLYLAPRTPLSPSLSPSVNSSTYTFSQSSWMVSSLVLNLYSWSIQGSVLGTFPSTLIPLLISSSLVAFKSNVSEFEYHLMTQICISGPVFLNSRLVYPSAQFKISMSNRHFLST